jgi:signal peptidase I
MSSLPSRVDPEPDHREETAPETVADPAQQRHYKRIGRYKYLLPVLIFVGFITWGFTTNYIPSESMLPSLKPGDHVVTMRTWLAYPFGRAPQRGDVVVFALPLNLPSLDEIGSLEERRRLVAERQEALHIPPGSLRHINGDILIKRVVGLPGETVLIKGRDIFINGRKLSGQQFGAVGKPDPVFYYNFASDEPLTLKQDEIFVLGDNISNSEDGRMWGPLKRRNILGRLVRVLWNDGGQKAAAEGNLNRAERGDSPTASPS